jgi:hypothetical protein
MNAERTSRHHCDDGHGHEQRSRYAPAGTAGAMLLLLVCATARSQDVTVSPSEYDRYAASQVQNARHHALAAKTPLGSTARTSELFSLPPEDNSDAAYLSPADSRYPGDMQYHGGKVVQNLEQYLIYVNLASSHSCTTIATCWGDPHAFLRDLGQSEFIHMVDRYVGRTEDDRYRVSDSPIFVNYPTTSMPLTDADMLTIVHAVAMSLPGTPAGYANLYHIFLVPGQDECLDATYTVCYSPDNPSTESFCAYHGWGDFNDIGHVLYTVEPAADNDACSSRPGTPNGQLVDSTNNILSHETFETISDPDNTAWWNDVQDVFYGAEIADECSFVIFTPTAVYFDPVNVTLNGRPYAAQPIYKNAAHVCTTAP